MCELIYYHAVIIFCICLVQNCLSQVKISETVCESVLVLKLSLLKRTGKRLFIHPCWKTFSAHPSEDVMRELEAVLRNTIRNVVTEKGLDISHICR